MTPLSKNHPSSRTERPAGHRHLASAEARHLPLEVTDGIDPETPSGRLVLQILSSLAEYERSLIRGRVQAGVDAARERGVRFGRPEADPEEVARKLRTVEHLVENEDMTVVDAAKTIGWSKSTYYRHLSSAGTA